MELYVGEKIRGEFADCLLRHIENFESVSHLFQDVF